jgi:hypothetical protein
VGLESSDGRGPKGTVIGNRYGISREILPCYETIDIHSESAANTLRLLMSNMTGEIEPLGKEVWLTPHGIVFGAGTQLDYVKTVLDELSEANPMSE